jgi:hypothetical protein
MLPAVLLTLTMAQSPPPDDEVARLERIRAQLAALPAIDVATPRPADGMVFRVTVQGKRPVDPLWANWSAVPSYIRPWFRADHHEFLEQVLKNRERPEQFRGPTLYPVGIDMVQVGQSLVSHIKASNRRRQEANAKEEVRQAIKELLACRANPGQPGC